MQIFSQILSPHTLSLRQGNRSETLGFSTSLSRFKRKNLWSTGVSLFDDTKGNLSLRAEKDKRNVVVSAVEQEISGPGSQRKRNVVEHICLVKAKEDLSEEQEKDMLDFLYTTQYQMRGIVALSLGRICDQNPELCTHGIFMRFQTKEDLAKFYENPFYMKVLKEHVMPYCHGFINFDYESEVEDDILPIFRKGEEFNYGVEFILLVEFSRNSLGGPADDAISSLKNLTTEFPSLIVQTTKGANLDTNNVEYTHGLVVRFRSVGAFKIFMTSSEYNTVRTYIYKLVLHDSDNLLVDFREFFYPTLLFLSWCKSRCLVRDIPSRLYDGLDLKPNPKNFSSYICKLAICDSKPWGQNSTWRYNISKRFGVGNRMEVKCWTS